MLYYIIYAHTQTHLTLRNIIFEAIRGYASERSRMNSADEIRHCLMATFLLYQTE